MSGGRERNTGTAVSFPLPPAPSPLGGRGNIQGNPTDLNPAPDLP